MSFGIVSVAMHLSGLDAHYFTSGDDKMRCVYEEVSRKLHAASSPIASGSTASASSSTASSTPNSAFSPTSSTNSSGFNSWSSAAHTPQHTILHTNINSSKILYHGKNLLDLGKNMEPWNLRYSELPKDVNHFFDNRSQYSRVKGDVVPLHVDVACEVCNFVQSYFD